MRKKYDDPREAHRITNKKWAKNNPTKVKRYQAKNRLKKADYNRSYARWKKYGLTEEEYQIRIKAQNGKCKICLGTPAQSLHVDHDHTNGAVRGLLCFNCNAGIGHLQDNAEIIRRALDYVERYTLHE